MSILFVLTTPKQSILYLTTVGPDQVCTKYVDMQIKFCFLTKENTQNILKFKRMSNVLDKTRKGFSFSFSFSLPVYCAVWDICFYFLSGRCNRKWHEISPKLGEFLFWTVVTGTGIPSGRLHLTSCSGVQFWVSHHLLSQGHGHQGIIGRVILLSWGTDSNKNVTSFI